MRATQARCQTTRLPVSRKTPVGKTTAGMTWISPRCNPWATGRLQVEQRRQPLSTALNSPYDAGIARYGDRPQYPSPWLALPSKSPKSPHILTQSASGKPGAVQTLTGPDIVDSAPETSIPEKLCHEPAVLRAGEYYTNVFEAASLA